MKRSALLRYGVAAGAVTLALLIKLLLEPVIVQETPFLLVFAAVIVSAWYGGLGPGLLATVTAGLATDYFFLSPSALFSGAPGLEAVPFILYMLEGLLITGIVVGLRSARQEAEISMLEAQAHQEGLLQSEQRYRAVVEQAVEGIFLVDVDTKRILEANPAYQNLLGYTLDELLGLTLYDVVAHDDENVDEYIHCILEQRSYSIGERRHRRKDGSLVDVEVNASIISSDGRDVICVVAHNITERKRTQQVLRRSFDSLLALYETAHILGSTLDRREIGTALLEVMQRVSKLSAAVISLRDEQERLKVWHALGPEAIWCSAHEEPEAQAARRAVLETEEHQLFELQRSDPEGKRLVVLCLPLRVRDQVIGVLEAYGSEALMENEAVELLTSLASQATSALENSRLYEELAARERQLQDLVGQLLVAQEEERRRVAYDIHDGLTQTAVAAYQLLQAFADAHPPSSPLGQQELDEGVKLVQRTVGEARQVIANLRPTALDDFGLADAIHQQVAELRSEDYEVSYEETLGKDRLPVAVETSLFRIAQEALTNVRKHSETTWVRITLQRLEQVVRLEVRDWGRGFQLTEVTKNRGGPGERVGLSSMRERVSLLGGCFEVSSKPGVGTSIVAEVPLLGGEEDIGHGK